MKIRFGAEVYTWFMNGEGKTHQGRLGHMIDITARAGFEGIEPIHFWMGELEDADLLREKLAAHHLSLAAIALCLPWNGSSQTEKETEDTERTIRLLGAFPGAMLCLVQVPSGRHDLPQRRRRLVNHLNEVSRKAADEGIPCSFHPNSPENSITRTEEDYRFLLEALDVRCCGWTPDVGHIINGGMDPLGKMKEYASLVNHVHYNDWDGNPEFCLMGEGKVDFKSITEWLVGRNYEGWIICEDEGKEAVDSPDKVTLHDGKWVRESLLSITKASNH
jgi:inosose dehydratase